MIVNVSCKKCCLCSCVGNVTVDLRYVVKFLWIKTKSSEDCPQKSWFLVRICPNGIAFLRIEYEGNKTHTFKITLYDVSYLWMSYTAYLRNAVLYSERLVKDLRYLVCKKRFVESEIINYRKCNFETFELDQNCAPPAHIRYHATVSS